MSLPNICQIFFRTGIDKRSNLCNFCTSQTEGNRQVACDFEFYNLYAIISVGYRANYKRSTAFREWAT
ncbi:MAG: RhuM family protein [Bacteroidales bacterium]